MTYLFEEFLDDQAVYLKNEAYYKALFSKVIGEESADYYTTGFKSGKKFFDGNPIFSTKYNERLIRIIQDEPESDKPYLKARLESKEDGVYELVINLELSKEIESKLEDYLKKWFKEKVSRKEMKKIIKSYDTVIQLAQQKILSEPEVKYKKVAPDKSKKESKFQIALDLYSREIKKRLDKDADLDLLKAVAKACGPSIYNEDSSKVSTSDKAELDRVKKNFLIKKLGLPDNSELDTAIKEVIEQLGSSNRNKYRAMFYYLLVKKFKKESIFLK